MIDDKFKEIMQSNTGCAVIMAGSYSDEPHIKKIMKSLDDFEIPYEVRIISAHKQLEKLSRAVANEYNKVGGLVAYVAVAGGTDGLSGALSFNAIGSVISCPPDAPNDSCLTNPPGSSNSCIPNPENVGRHIAQMYAGVNPRFREILEEKISNKIAELEKKDIEFRQTLSNYRGK